MTAIALPAAPDRYRFKYLIAITVSLASVLELLDTSIVNVAIPHMMGNLGATLDQIAWVSTGYIVANVIVLPITGWLSAYFGRRRYFAGSIALFTLASFLCGNAGSLGALVFWRIIQGLGGGALLSTSQAILYEVFPREEYGTAMAIFGVGVMVGPTLGPTVGGWITDMYGWPWIFYINIPFGMLALALTMSFINDSRHQERASRVDFVGLGLLRVGIGASARDHERDFADHVHLARAEHRSSGRGSAHSEEQAARGWCRVRPGARRVSLRHRLRPSGLSPERAQLHGQSNGTRDSARRAGQRVHDGVDGTVDGEIRRAIIDCGWGWNLRALDVEARAFHHREWDVRLLLAAHFPRRGPRPDFRAADEPRARRSADVANSERDRSVQSHAAAGRQCGDRALSDADPAIHRHSSRRSRRQHHAVRRSDARAAGDDHTSA